MPNDASSATEGDGLVPLGTRRTELEAEMVKGRLSADGVECFLSGNRVASCVGPVTALNASWSNPVGGVEIRVRASDLTFAGQILDECDTAAEPPEGSPRGLQRPMLRFAVLSVFHGLGPVVALAILICGSLSTFGRTIVKKVRHDNHH